MAFVMLGSTLQVKFLVTAPKPAPVRFCRFQGLFWGVEGGGITSSSTRSMAYKLPAAL